MRDENYFKYITKFKSVLNHKHLASNELTRNEQKKRRRKGGGKKKEKASEPNKLN